MRLTGFAISAAFVLAAATSPVSGATFYLTTGIGTHETVIDGSSSPTWNFFGENTVYTHFAGGVFEIKHGPGTTFGIQLELIDNSTMIVGSVSYADANAFLAAGGSSEFDKFVFLIDSIGFPLINSEYYTVKVSLVGDGDPTGQSYVIRGMDGGEAERVVTDDPTNIIVTQPSTAPVPTPEPASAVLFGAGLLALTLSRSIRRA